MHRIFPTVPPAERLWVRFSVAALTATGLTIAVIAFPPDSIGTQIYVLAMVALMIVIIAIGLGFRHAWVARVEGADGDDAAVFFARAVLVGAAPDAPSQVLGKGWVTRVQNELSVWELDRTHPDRKLLDAPPAVEPIHASVFSRPLARFRFADGGYLDAVVIRRGYGDLRGWSAADIRAMDLPAT